MAGIKSWSTVAANNVLANTGFTMDESMAPSSLNDSIRQLMADVRSQWFVGANIASATPDLSAATGGYIHMTGTTTITALGTVSAGIRQFVEFDGALTLTHNAASLILPGGVNITTVAKDVGIFVSLGSGNWKCIAYVGQNANFTNITASGTAKVGTGAAVGGATPGTGGLAFPETAVAVVDVNTLDDYEEGGWTPTNAGSGAAVHTGKYTKIGSAVFITFNILVDGATNYNASFGGLPFINISHYGGGAVSFNNTAQAASGIAIDPSNTTFSFYPSSAGSGTAVVFNGSNKSLIGSAIYFT